MQHEFWHNAWEQGKTGWRQQKQNSRLRRFWALLALPAGSTVLVPLCGDTPDMRWLLDHGFNVTGCELSENALIRFLEDQAIDAEVHERVTVAGSYLREYRAAPSGGRAALRLLCGDFLSLSAEDVGPLDAFYDRAATVAMPSELRDEYAMKLAELTSPRQASIPALSGVTGLLISMTFDQQKMIGPPFSVPQEEINRLYGKAFKITCVGGESGPEILGNLKDRGLDTLEETVYQLTRH